MPRTELMPHSIALVSSGFPSHTWKLIPEGREVQKTHGSWVSGSEPYQVGCLQAKVVTCLFWKIYLKYLHIVIYYVCVCTNVYSWTLTCHDVCIEDLRKSVAVVCVCFLYHASLRDRTQVIWFGSRCLYLLNYLPGPHDNLNIHLL